MEGVFLVSLWCVCIRSDDFIIQIYFFLFQSASALLDEKQKDGSDLTNIGFYESRNEWMGRRHFLLAIKGYGRRIFILFFLVKSSKSRNFLF